MNEYELWVEVPRRYPVKVNAHDEAEAKAKVQSEFEQSGIIEYMINNVHEVREVKK